MAKRIRQENADRWVDDLPWFIAAEGALRARWEQRAKGWVRRSVACAATRSATLTMGVCGQLWRG
jgi:hypothetical protein